jgi:hypothetical protein
VARQSNQALTEAHRLRKTGFQTVFAPTSGVAESRGSLRTTKLTYNARAICVSTSAASAASEESDTPIRQTPSSGSTTRRLRNLRTGARTWSDGCAVTNYHQQLKGHFAKYRKLVPALALINHLADGGKG